MRWECSECGAELEWPRLPVRCWECGTAGGIFVELDEAAELDRAENLREHWLRAGFERAEPQLAA